MVKTQVRYVCQNCGQDFPRWLGQCSNCGLWNTLVEEKMIAVSKSKLTPKKDGKENQPYSIIEIKIDDETRVKSNINEIDRVLGGGLVKGAVTLISGEPGIGKSTLMLQISNLLCKNHKVLYVSGEESIKQIRIRAERLGTLSKNLIVLSETDLFAIEQNIEKLKPDFLIIDSIQTLNREDLSSAAGSVSQVRECAAYLVRIAKTQEIATFIVGHVTKDGSIAGPRVLEHIVDTVLYFEGERHRQYRIIRVIKNRFGSTNEVGIFEMKSGGLEPVDNPSNVFLTERDKAIAGNVIGASMEGTRPLLLEIQALVFLSQTAIPRRIIQGADFNRVSVIIGVLTRRLGLKLSNQDIYVNLAGGLKISEPALDLPIALSIASCFKDKIISSNTIAIGEIGLGGEIRAVSRITQRIAEAKKMGFKTIIIPKNNIDEIKNKKEVVAVDTLGQALSSCF